MVDLGERAFTDQRVHAEFLAGQCELRLDTNAWSGDLQSTRSNAKDG
jgi:hypothetical protein